MSNVHPKKGGPYSLYCEDCGCWVPNTANYEMKKEGMFAYSHTCSNGICDMKNGEKKVVNESKVTHAVLRSDYSPETRLVLAKTEDGDVVMKIIGKGEMRIATSGGQFHGEELLEVLDAFQTIMKHAHHVE